MVPSGFSVIIALFLSLCCWLGTALPASAQPATPHTLLTWEIAMGSKPLFSFSGKRPDNLGVKEGKLAPCPNSPNCVGSQIPDSDTEHKIAPIVYKSSPTEALSKLKSVITEMERTKLISETSDYLYAEFTSALMGYVDDVEFYFDPSQPNQIQVRSASRLGQSDLGVNRKRIEEIRSKLASLDA
jgi:uncharacterized protein (DUF1499 family)